MVMDIESFNRREKMLKLREALLSAEAERLAGQKEYTVDELSSYLDDILKGAENGIEKTPAVEYYTLGEGCWKSAENWPPENTVSERTSCRNLES